MLNNSPHGFKNLKRFAGFSNREETFSSKDCNGRFSVKEFSKLVALPSLQTLILNRSEVDCLQSHWTCPLRTSSLTRIDLTGVTPSSDELRLLLGSCKSLKRFKYEVGYPKKDGFDMIPGISTKLFPGILKDHELTLETLVIHLRDKWASTLR